MAFIRLFAALLVAALSLAAVSEAVVLCPIFPACCFQKTRLGNACHPLCPDCDEAFEYTRGVRNRLYTEAEAHRNELILERLEHSPRVSFITGPISAYRGDSILPRRYIIL
ncbi:uncharacterized protein LOC135196852 [Macrobrachium nipponense]|uniref:uncharacterized protein LOC135196852 n=1 Tax=Macrobrachium nipponense TaxID=159736 RepID=UPI0030C862E9